MSKTLLLSIGIPVLILAFFIWYISFASKQAKELVRNLIYAINILGAIFVVIYLLFGLITELF